jgi:hypothetical protein
MTEELNGRPESIVLFMDTARSLSARLRTDKPAPCQGDPVRVHDGKWPLAVRTDRYHAEGFSNVRLHRHLSWQPSMQIDVYGDGSAPNELDLGTNTAAGTADLIDFIVDLVDRHADHAPAYDLLQTVADVCGALIGPVPMPIIVRAPTPWAAARLYRADEAPLDAPTETTALLAAIPIMVSPTFWVQERREDVPSHPRASLRGWSVVARPTDPMTVARMLRDHPETYADAGKDMTWA